MTETSRFASRVFALVSLGLIGVGLFLVLKPFLAPLLWAGLLALMLYPANVALRQGLRGRNGLAALLLTVAVVLIVIVPSVMLAGTFVSQAADLAKWLQATATQHHIAQPSDLLAIPAVDRVVKWVTARVPISADEIRTAAISGAQQALQVVLSQTGSLFAGALDVLVTLILTIVMFFFLLRDGEEIVRRGLAVVPLDARRKSHLAAHLSGVIRGVVLGSVVTAIVQGALVGVAFAIVGLPSPIVFAVLAMLASLVPMVGSTLVWVPATIVLAVQTRWGAVIFMIAWSIGVVSSADNIIRPMFVSSHAKISTLPVFIGLIGGVSAFGPMGMFLGPLLVALVLALLQFAEEANAEESLVGRDGGQV